VPDSTPPEHRPNPQDGPLEPLGPPASNDYSEPRDDG
jgi:hypothetical protein